MKAIKNSISLILLLTGIGYTIIAQDYSGYRFSQLTQKNGLSHNNIECIYKDSQGLMWFGTRNGLCSFNGYDITVYHSQRNTNSISGDRILSIAEDKTGSLWIGTYADGLNRYDRRDESFKHYGASKSIPERINRIKVFKDGSLWVCSSNGLALYLPETDSFKVFMHEPGNMHSLNSNVIYDILETSRGEVYVATENQAIQKFNPKTEKFETINYARDKSLNSNYRKRIVEDLQGILWIAADVHGLCSYDPATGASSVFTSSNSALASNILTGELEVDNSGNIWICTDGMGINIFNPTSRKFSTLRNKPFSAGTLSSDHVYTVYFDDLGILWVGTFGQGVNFFDPSRYKFNSNYLNPGDLEIFKEKSVISIFQDSKQRIWVGTDGFGLYMINQQGKIQSYFHNPENPNSLSTNVITSLGEEPGGDILIGTYSGGLLAFNPESNRFKRFNTLKENYRPSSDNIWRILTDSQKRTWLGLLGSAADLYDVNTGIFNNLGPYSNKPDRINFQNVMTIMEDTDGDIWFGTEGMGIFILDKETNRIYRINPEQYAAITSSGIIISLHQDRWGYIWIGTEGDGMLRFDKKTNQTEQFTVQDGLPGNIIQSILEDIQGNIWMGTTHGLAVYNPTSKKFRHYIEEDGLSGNEFNPNALIQLTDGRFLAGTTSGLDIFRPEEITQNQNLPRTILTKLTVLNHVIHPGIEFNNKQILTKSIAFTSALTLTPKEKVFSLEFAALNYTLPEKCQYAYKLEGFDDSWFYTSSKRRFASYSNLPAGSYIFRVKASNNDGKWGNNETQLTIHILPPYYKTWWFKILLILTIGSLIALIYRYRLNRHKVKFQQEQARQEKIIVELEKEKLEAELQKLTFHIINRNKVLIEQKNRLTGLSLKAREVVKIGLEEIIKQIDEDLTNDKDWVYIEPQLDKVYNNFVSRLKEKHPDLSLSEIKIAAYVRMNLSTKEISEFMHKTARAIENDRYRLRKKIGLDTNDSLSNYLMNL